MKHVELMTTLVFLYVIMCQVMRDTLHMELKWSKFVSILVSPSHYRPDVSGIQCIAYVDFLNSFSENLFGSEKLVFKSKACILLKR